MPFGNRKNYFRGYFSSLLSQFKKYHRSGNLKFNNSGIFQSLVLRVLVEKIFQVSLQLNFIPNSLGCYELRRSNETSIIHVSNDSCKFLQQARAFTMNKADKLERVTKKKINFAYFLRRKFSSFRVRNRVLSGVLTGTNFGLVEFTAQLLELGVGLFEIVVVVELERLLLGACGAAGVGLLCLSARPDEARVLKTPSAAPTLSHIPVYPASSAVLLILLLLLLLLRAPLRIHIITRQQNSTGIHKASRLRNGGTTHLVPVVPVIHILEICLIPPLPLVLIRASAKNRSRLEGVQGQRG